MKFPDLSRDDNQAGIMEPAGLTGSKLTNRCFRLKALAAAVACATSAQTAQSQLLEEIVVTATRRSESVQDVPYNISAITSASLQSKRAFGLGDLSRIVPGLAYIDQGAVARGNNNNFIMRGLNAQAGTNNISVGTQNVSAVSTYFGETPVFFAMPLKDMERIEVLRGPQGTLYGSGAVGGTIRFIPTAPDLEKFSWKVDTHVDVTDDSDELGYGADGAVNIPLVENQLGLRIAGGYDESGGFVDAKGRAKIDNMGTPDPAVPGDLTSGFVLDPRNNVNDADNWWLRTTLLWQPTDTLDAVIRYQHLEADEDNPQVVNPGVPGLTVDNSVPQVPGSIFPNALAVPGGAFPNGATVFPATGDNKHLVLRDQPYEQQVDVVGLDVHVDFGFATLTSNTSYYKAEEAVRTDRTGAFETVYTPGGNNFAYFYNFYPRLASDELVINEDEGFVQELRVASQTGNRWDYVIGAFYQDVEEILDFDQWFWGLKAFDAATINFHANPQLGDLVFTSDRVTKFEDVAVFGEVTFHISEQWQVTGGVRGFWQEFSNDFVFTFPYCGSLCASDGVDSLGKSVIGPNEESFSDYILKFNTSYDLTEDMMLYATRAEGFRRGGANALPTAGLFASLPELNTYQPDEATNWEIGIKGSLWDKVNYTLAGYFIEWENFQFEDAAPSLLFAVFNGNEAETIGMELELNGRLTEELSFDIGYAYTDTEVTKNSHVIDLPAFALLNDPALPPVVSVEALKGDTLPGSPKHSLTVSVDYRQPLRLGAGWMLHYHIDGSYRSKANSAISPTSQFGRNFFVMDEFSIWNVALNLEADQWRAGIYVRNLFNEDGITGGVPEAAFGTRSAYFHISRPRTVGLNIGYEYF